MKKDRTLTGFRVDERGLNSERPAEVGDREPDSVVRDWTIISFNSTPTGWANHYRASDGEEWVEDCPGFLVQEWVSITAGWECPREDPNEVDIYTHTYAVPANKAGIRRVVPAGFQDGEFVSAMECEVMGEYMGTSSPN